MAFTRIYTGEDGQSHFEEMETPFQPGDPAQPGSFSQGAGGITFRRQPVGLVQDWHTAPRRQYIINLTGLAEIEIGSGERRRFGPGDVLLADDLTGRGHVTRVIGSEPRLSVTVPIDD